MTNPFFGNMPQQKGVAPPAAPSGTTSLTSDIDPIKRAKFTGYLQGMSANAVPPQPPQPPMMPQPPMPMNMGGMVDVFDPMYMNQGGFVISTDDSGKIRTRPVFDEDRGRMVSQIMSRDMVDEMAKAAMAKANQPEPAPPPIVVEPESKLVAIKEMLEDDYELREGFPETTQPVTTEPTISLPVQKPIVSDTDVKGPRRSGIDLPVTKPVIQLPVSKPSVASEDVTDIPSYERFKADYTDIPNYLIQGAPDKSLTFEKRTKPFVKPKLNVLRSLIGEEDGGIEEYDDPEELRDAAIYSDIRDIDDLGTLGANIPPEEMKTIARMITEGEKTSGPDVDIFDVIPLIDRFGEMDLVTDEVPKLRKLTGLEKLLKFIFPKSGFNQQFTAPSGQGIDSFNTGGIVQGFRAGGFAKDRYEDFSSNIRGDVGGRVDIRDIDDLGSATPIFKTTSTPRDTSDDDLRRDEDQVESTGPVYDAFLKSQESPFAPIVNKIGESVFGKSPYDLFYTTQQNLKPDSMQSRIARDRQLDRERAERKLAEEQRLRDMIAGMMPKTATTPAPPMVTAPDAPVADPVTPDYSSVVVPSDRVPGFDVGKISPFPQFRMPTEFTPVFPESLSANYFRDLFKNIGVNKMQEGGAVNQLDSAIDNFINAYR